MNSGARWRHAGHGLLGVLLMLGVLAILAAIAVPSWQQAVVRMRRGEAQGVMLELMLQQERHYTQFNRYLAFSADSDDPAARRFRWWSGRTPAASAYELEGKPCDDAEIDDCIQLVATPGTARVDGKFRDPQCERLILTSTGLHLASGPGPRCWR